MNERMNTGTYLSDDGKTEIFYTVWMPESTPKGIVQIVHGMCEYTGRYAEFAAYLTDRGYIVCGNDHLGHGKTAILKNDLGYFADKDGDVCVVNDVLQLTKIMRQKYRFLPYILFGHSFGSFIARALVASHPDAVDAAVFSGTSGSKPPFALGKFMANAIGFFRGGHYRSNLLFKAAFGSYNDRFKDEPDPTGYEWVTNDREKLTAYANDPYCTFRFTAKAYADMFTVLQFISTDKWYDIYPKSMPTLLLAGENDPVGQYGEGVREVYSRLKDQSLSSLSALMYKGERHEVLNGLNRQVAYADILKWLNETCDGIVSARVQRNNW